MVFFYLNKQKLNIFLQIKRICFIFNQNKKNTKSMQKDVGFMTYAL